MERESFKEYSEAAIVEKEKHYAIKSCFEELHMFLSLGGNISSGGKTQQAECKRNYIFRSEFMMISICD